MSRSNRGKKIEGVCLKHGEVLHYLSNGHCIHCNAGYPRSMTKEQRCAYQKAWKKKRMKAGKKFEYGIRYKKRKERARRRVPTELLQRKRPRRKKES